MKERSARNLSLAVSIAAAVLAFACSAVWEAKIAAAAAEAAATMGEIAANERILRLPVTLDEIGRTVDRNVMRLGLQARPSAQQPTLIEALARIAALRSLRLVAIRRQPAVTENGRQKPPRRFTADRYEVRFEGSYAATLRTLSDLARVPLVLSTERIAFERARSGAPSGAEISATLLVAVFRLGGSSE